MKTLRETLHYQKFNTVQDNIPKRIRDQQVQVELDQPHITEDNN